MAPIRVCELETGSPSHQVEQVPGHPRSQQRQHHDDRRLRGRVDQQVHRQQVDDAEGDRRAAQQHAQEVAEAGEEHGRHRPQRPGVDHRRHGVGRVVEAVDHLEAEGDEQGHRQDDHAVRVEVADASKSSSIK